MPTPPAETFERAVHARSSLLSIDLAEIWRYRDMLYFLALRDFKIRYKQSLLGVAWAVLQPLISLAVCTLIFNQSLNIETDVPYPVFFLAGLIPWNLFSKSLLNASSSVVAETELIRKVYFPRIILPVGSILSNLSDFIITFSLFISLSLFYPVNFGLHLLLLPIFLCLTLGLALSLSLWLAPLNVRFRDIQIVVPFMLQILFFISPLAYPLDNVPEKFRCLLALNPVAGLLEGFRYSLLGVGNPWRIEYLIAYAVMLVLLLGGIVFFNSNQRRFADII